METLGSGLAGEAQEKLFAWLKKKGDQITLWCARHARNSIKFIRVKEVCGGRKNLSLHIREPGKGRISSANSNEGRISTAIIGRTRDFSQ